MHKLNNWIAYWKDVIYQAYFFETSVFSVHTDRQKAAKHLRQIESHLSAPWNTDRFDVDLLAFLKGSHY